MQQQVHMVMGKEEAAIIGMALSLMTEVLNQDIKNEVSDSEELLAMFSMKFSTTQMMTEIAALLAEGGENE